MMGRHAQPPGGGGHSRKESRPSTPGDRDADYDNHKRSFSDATPRPTPLPPRPLGQDSNLSNNLTVGDSLAPPSSKRLGFFTDKLSGGSSSQSLQTHNSQGPSASGHRSSPIPSHPGLIPPRSHSRVDSNPRDPSIMASSVSIPNTNKPHTSPSKSTTGRTYDARLVSREMHRLGNLSHLPTHLPASLATAASSSTLTLPATVNSSVLPSSSAERDNPWGSLHVHVLPLFNGEPLRVPIEDLNTLVKRHIEAVLSASPSKALSTLENDASELIASGMVTLNSKFMNIEENKVLGRVIDMWGFFWDQVLPYVEGALLPLQTDPLLAALYRGPKPHRPSSPTRQASGGKGSISLSSHNISALGSSSHPHIDVRTVGMRGFRDQIILPLFPRLYARLSMPNRMEENEGYIEPRCNQMMLVLAFQTRQPSPPPSFSLTSPNPPSQIGPGEKALADLIRALRLPSSSSAGSKSNKNDTSKAVRAPSFLSGGLPRDRRGRIAQKRTTGGIGIATEDEEIGWDDGGGETPRNGFMGNTTLDMEREREREFLEGLRSPDPISNSGVGARASVGGWGLGDNNGGEDSGRTTVEEDEYHEDDDEPLTWDEAQLMVEKSMVYPPRAQEDHAGTNSRPQEVYEGKRGMMKDRTAADKQIKRPDISTIKPTGRRMT